MGELGTEGHIFDEKVSIGIVSGKIHVKPTFQNQTKTKKKLL